MVINKKCSIKIDVATIGLQFDSPLHNDYEAGSGPAGCINSIVSSHCSISDFCITNTALPRFRKITLLLLRELTAITIDALN